MKYYKIEYTLLFNGRRLYYQSNNIKALCKVHALIKFKIKYKHRKSLKREILKIRRIKENVSMVKKNNKKSR